ncbi:hypothetical protein EUTSA_v10028291mg [Eutrema salsugineum]|uniref:TIR domain-containing protein n=1 Tax=Eutrema salsugineum TaxID=72664 RepID=V4LWM1_EUTSA|nr:hypothetical protein EUTSA_v10028291mg [Eutrema salsugineum]
MSSSSSWRYDVFPSFRGSDVRRGFLSHLHNDFALMGIKTFNDQKMERGHSLERSLDLAIRESRVLMVLLSKNYASSLWCLNELVEILECRKNMVQCVLPVFYHVDPSDVRSQSGDFGNGFKKSCQGKNEEEKQIWSKALTKVANIAGLHCVNSYDDSEMIKKIATYVHEVLANETRTFKGMRMVDQRMVKEKVIVLSWRTEEEKIAFVMDDEAEMIQKIATVRDYNEICDILANETVSSYKKGRFSVSKRTFRGMRMIDQRIVIKEKVIVLALKSVKHA